MNSDNTTDPSSDSKLTIVDIARSPYVTRWNSVAVHRSQNVAEHSFMTSMYALELAKHVYPKIDAEEKLKLLEHCLWHDIPEVVTGDMPTPLKRIIETRHPGLIESIEVQACPQAYQLKQALNGTPLQRLAKLADMLDAIVFLHHEAKEPTAETIKEKLISRFHVLVTESTELYPGLHWPTCSQILDQLLTRAGKQLEFDWSTME